MPDFLAVASVDKLTAPSKPIDWFDDINPPLREGQATPGRYGVGNGTVTLTGRGLAVRTCSTDSYNAGFPKLARLLVAQPPARRTANTAVMTLVFEPPVTDLGCSVGGVFGAHVGDPFSARMWVYHTDTSGWDGIVTGTGNLANPVPKDALPSVPFLGVRGVNGRRIARVGIEASLIGNVPLETVAISGLFVTP